MVLAMNEIEFVQDALEGEPQARSRFIERYSDDIFRALLQTCRQNCQAHCPIRYSLEQATLNEMRCDELADMYLFSIEYITKSSLKYFRGNTTLDNWMNAQLNIKGDYFKYMFNAYLAKKYPITGKARVPDRFSKIWSKPQKNIYRAWLRGKSIPEIADRLRLPEQDVQKIVDDLINQLEEAGLLGGLMESLSFEQFDARRRLTDTHARNSESRVEGQPETSTQDEGDYEPGERASHSLLVNAPVRQSDTVTQMLIDSLRNALAIAISKLSAVERHLLSLKFDREFTLARVAQASNSLNLGNLTASQVGHRIDDTLKKMLPTINRQLSKVDDVSLQLRGLKRVLMEWGVKSG